MRFSLEHLSKTFLILRKTVVCSKIYIGIHVQYTLLLSDFNETWIISPDFRTILIENFMKIHPVGAELYYAESRPDMMKLLVTFRSTANATKSVQNVACHPYYVRLKTKPN